MPLSPFAPAIHADELHPSTEWPTKYHVDDNGCWVFDGRSYPGTPYGAARFKGRRHYVHRLAYRLWRGEIPAALTVDHTCLNKLCINPDHLEVVTAAENSRRAIFSRPGRDMCVAGLHPWPDSARTFKFGNRRCGPCHDEYQRAYRMAHRAVAA